MSNIEMIDYSSLKLEDNTSVFDFGGLCECSDQILIGAEGTPNRRFLVFEHTENGIKTLVQLLGNNKFGQLDVETPKIYLTDADNLILVEIPTATIPVHDGLRGDNTQDQILNLIPLLANEKLKLVDHIDENIIERLVFGYNVNTNKFIIVGVR